MGPVWNLIHLQRPCPSNALSHHFPYNNPKYVLRNYIAQGAIEAAESGDFSEASATCRPPSPAFIGCGGGRAPTAPLALQPLQVRRVLKLLETPYGGEAEAAEPTEASEADRKSVV